MKPTKELIEQWANQAHAEVMQSSSLLSRSTRSKQLRAAIKQHLGDV